MAAPVTPADAVLEALAVGLAVIYLALAIRENRWCWAAGIASSLLYIRVFAVAGLMLQAALQLLYVALAAYGWYRWAEPRQSAAIVRWPPVIHALLLALALLVAAVAGALVSRLDGAVLPWADAIVTATAVVATWLTARKVLENWYWWFVIDAASLLLYATRGLWLTCALFTGYLAMIFIGYRAWRRRWTATLA